MPDRTKNIETPRKRLKAAARREIIEEAATEVFAEHGYQGASIDEIASRSGVTPPVVYDHFVSKRDLYRRLLESHFADLRQVWGTNFKGDDPPERRIARSFDAWFAYIEKHPFAGRTLFRDTSGDPDVAAMHAEVAARSREATLPLFAAALGAESIADLVIDESLDMAWIVMREVLQGLAIWWGKHPHVPRERVLAMAMNALWIGFERALGGEVFSPVPDEK